MKSSFMNLVILSGLTLLAACQPMQGNSLLTDQSSDPSTHVLNKDPKSEELYLKSYSANVNTTSAVTKAEVSGECYTSTFPKHNIIVLEGGLQLDIVDLNPATDVNSKTASCKNGKFNLAINTSTLAGGVHTLRFVLQAWDAQNQLVVNDVQGVSSVTLTK